MYNSASRTKREIFKMVESLNDENCQEVLSFMKRIQNIERDREKYHAMEIRNYA